MTTEPCFQVHLAESGIKSDVPCAGEVDEFYTTDGGLITLCDAHMRACRVVVWDGPQPMTKKYYDEVYSLDHGIAAD